MDIKNFHINKYNEYKHDKEIKTKWFNTQKTLNYHKELGREWS